MTQPLPFSTLSPFGSDLTILLLTMKGKNTEAENAKAFSSVIIKEPEKNIDRKYPTNKALDENNNEGIYKTPRAKVKKRNSDVEKMLKQQLVHQYTK